MFPALRPLLFPLAFLVISGAPMAACPASLPGPRPACQDQDQDQDQAEGEAEDQEALAKQRQEEEAKSDTRQGLLEEIKAAKQAVEDANQTHDAAREHLKDLGEAASEAEKKAVPAAEETRRETALELKAIVQALEEGGAEIEDSEATRKLYQDVLGKEEQKKTLEEYREEAKALTTAKLRTEFAKLEVLYELDIKAVAEAESELGAAAEEDQPAKQEALDQRKEERSELGEILQVYVSELRERGEDTSSVLEAEKTLTQQEGVSSERFSFAVLWGIVGEWVQGGKNWLVSNAPGLLFKVLVVLVILLVFKFLGFLSERLVRRALSSERLNLSSLLRNFAIGLVRKTVMLIGLLIAVSTVGVDIAPLLAGVGVIGLVIGFALQDTLSNFASGIMLLVYRPYDVGDGVEAGGVGGKVHAMTLVSTTILTYDNKIIVVPNNKIWGNVITNVNAQTTRRVDLMFGIGYEDDIAQAESVLEEIVTSHELVLKDPEPLIKLHNLGDSSMDFLVRPWCKTGDYWDVYWDITRAVKLRFDAEGISIPYPQRDIHLVQQASSGEETAPPPTPVNASTGLTAKSAPKIEAKATKASRQRASEADLRQTADVDEDEGLD